jgi:hypothetical protein
MTVIPVNMVVTDVSRCAVTNCAAKNRHPLPRATSWKVSGYYSIPLDPREENYIEIPFEIPLCDKCRALVVD